MARRDAGKMSGQRYLANTNSKEVHDLDRETGRCQIDRIIEAGNDKPYLYLNQAHADGFDNCANYTIGSLR